MPSFYPIFPPPLDLVQEVNLDISHSNRLKLDETAPRVLILPSKLKQFHKVSLVDLELSGRSQQFYRTSTTLLLSIRH